MTNGKRISYSKNISVIKNVNKKKSERIASIFDSPDIIFKNEKYFEEFLLIVLNKEEELDVRMSILESIQAASFNVIPFQNYRKQYISALRKILKDPDQSLREFALVALSCEHDGYAQKKLIDGLDNPEKALVSTEFALQCLGNNVHSDAYTAAKKIIRNPPSESAREEALKLLSADASSAKTFEKLLLDKNESPACRLISASALQTINPDSMAKHAKKVLEDLSDDDAVHEACITALTNFSVEVIDNDSKLQGNIKKIQKK